MHKAVSSSPSSASGRKPHSMRCTTAAAAAATDKHTRPSSAPFMHPQDKSAREAAAEGWDPSARARSKPDPSRRAAAAAAAAAAAEEEEKEAKAVCLRRAATHLLP